MVTTSQGNVAGVAAPATLMKSPSAKHSTTEAILSPQAKIASGDPAAKTVLPLLVGGGSPLLKIVARRTLVIASLFVAGEAVAADHTPTWGTTTCRLLCPVITEIGNRASSWWVIKRAERDGRMRRMIAPSVPESATKACFGRPDGKVKCCRQHEVLLVDYVVGLDPYQAANRDWWGRCTTLPAS